MRGRCYSSVDIRDGVNHELHASPSHDGVLVLLGTQGSCTLRHFVQILPCYPIYLVLRIAKSE